VPIRQIVSGSLIFRCPLARQITQTYIHYTMMNPSNFVLILAAILRPGMMSSSFELPAAAATTRRRAQPASVADCGQVLESWTSSEISAILEAGIDRNVNNLGPAGEDLKALALPLVQYGVQVRKVCAAYSDFNDNGDASSRYGGDVVHSGLLMIPLRGDNDDDSMTIAEGTHKAIIYCHGTRAVAQPSTDWAGEDSDLEIILNMLFTATSRSVTIMPDYMGQGESFGQVYRGYIVRESYETSVIPLFQQAGKFLEDETDCSAVADSVFLFGYSEGGYSSLSIADKLSSMGYDIIRVNSGGAPYWVSSGTFVDIVQFVNEGVFPTSVRYYLAYLGFSFSSSRTDMPNFDAGQDLLTADAKQKMLDYLASDRIPGIEEEGIAFANEFLVPEDDMLSIYNPDFIAFIQEALMNGENDPCKNQPIEGNNDLLCKAMQDQDIHNVLLNVTFPVVVCHSQDEEIVSYRNVPDLSQNAMISTQVSMPLH